MSDQLREALREALATYRCREHLDEDGDGVPLVDVLTHGGDVGPGKRELEALADHLYDELPDAALAQPVQVEAPATAQPVAQFTASEQKGIPGHCFVAQVFGPDGEAYASIDPTLKAEIASERARKIAAALNAAPSRAVQVEPRFFLDHGVVHDRVTGRHVWFDNDVEPGCAEWSLALLNDLAAKGTP